MKKVTIVLTIPKPLFSKLNDETIELYKKHGKDCESKYPNDCKYRDVPHITLLTMGACYKSIKKIESKLREIAKKHKPLKIKSKRIVLFNGRGLKHLVIEIKNTKQIQELHNDIVKELMPISKNKDGYILEQYEPHCSKIINMPKTIANNVKKDAKIKEFEFTANEIGIKVRQENTYCTIEKRLKLGKNKNNN